MFSWYFKSVQLVAFYCVDVLLRPKDLGTCALLFTITSFVLLKAILLHLCDLYTKLSGPVAQIL